jgi:hypothetical protein
MLNTHSDKSTLERIAFAVTVGSATLYGLVWLSHQIFSAPKVIGNVGGILEACTAIGGVALGLLEWRKRSKLKHHNT